MKENLKLLIDGNEITGIKTAKIAPVFTNSKLPLTLPVRCFLPFEAWLSYLLAQDNFIKSYFWADHWDEKDDHSAKYHQEKEIKSSLVLATHAFAYPGAMMVITLYADVAIYAMPCSACPYNIASMAKLCVYFIPLNYFSIDIARICLYAWVRKPNEKIRYDAQSYWKADYDSPKSCQQRIRTRKHKYEQYCNNG